MVAGILRNLRHPRRQGDVMHSLADIEKARTLLGYEPSTTFEEGLERTVVWGRVRATT